MITVKSLNLKKKGINKDKNHFYLICNYYKRKIFNEKIVTM